MEVGIETILEWKINLKFKKGVGIATKSKETHYNKVGKWQCQSYL